MVRNKNDESNKFTNDESIIDILNNDITLYKNEVHLYKSDKIYIILFISSLIDEQYEDPKQAIKRFIDLTNGYK